jgi:hypothetical protein
MQEGETRELIARVERLSAPGEPQPPPGEDPVVMEDLMVGTPMTARLIGKSFTIDPPEASLRVLSSSKPAEWSWKITPTSIGEETLTLELAVVLDETNLTPIEPPGLYKEDIDVSVDPWRTPVRLATTVNGFLVTVGFGGLAAVAMMLWPWARRRRAEARPRGKSSDGARAGGPTARKSRQRKKRSSSRR